MKRWYVVQTKSHQEAQAIQHLKDQKFKTFFPKFMHTRIDMKTKKEVIKSIPMFPSYVFVQFDITRNRRWQSINGTRGVAGIIGYTKDFLTPLPIGCVEAIIARSNKKGFIDLEPTIAEIIKYSEGMKMMITTGSMAGTIATYCNHTENRVVLLLTLLSRPVKLSLPLDAVKPAPL